MKYSVLIFPLYKEKIFKKLLQEYGNSANSNLVCIEYKMRLMWAIFLEIKIIDLYFVVYFGGGSVFYLVMCFWDEFKDPVI